MKVLSGVKSKIALGAAALLSSSLALASTAGSSSGAAMGAEAFDGFSQTVQAWASGGLGTGISLLTLLVGAGMGVARNSPMPALAGVGTAAFLRWGPEIITTMVSGGALI